MQSNSPSATDASVVRARCTMHALTQPVFVLMRSFTINEAFVSRAHIKYSLVVQRTQSR